MGSNWRRRVGCAVAFLVVPAIAAAQDFETLATKIRTGQTVLVRDTSGAETRGVVQQVDGSHLVVKYGAGRFPDPTVPGATLNDTRTFTPADVARVRRPGPIWDGAVKGAAVALVPALLFAAVDCFDCGKGEAAALMLAIGAGTGVGIDALWGPKTVYRAPRGPRNVSVVPLVTRDRRGVMAAIRF